jgi:recombination protein RecT
MNEIATQKRSPIVQFKHDLSRLVEAKELALPSNVSAESFRNAAIVAAQDNPQILQCSAETVFKSIRKLAAAGLVPDGKEAALVPFKGSCTAIPMVSGLVKMARRSGDVKDIRAHLVYQNEVDQGRFTYIVGDEERLEHDPILFAERGDLVGTYAIAKLKDGTLVREFMSMDDVERIRKAAASQRPNQYDKTDGPKGIWKEHFGEMVKKTVIRRLVKRLDLSAEDMRHITMDDEPREIRDVSPPEPPPMERVNLAQRIQNPEPEGALDGEVMPPEDDSQAGPDDTSLEYAMGQTAARDGASLNECPYEQGTQEWLDWAGGWNAAKETGDE